MKLRMYNISIAVVNVLLVVLVLFGAYKEGVFATGPHDFFKERAMAQYVDQIREHKEDFDEVSKILAEVATEKGGLYGFEVLERADFGKGGLDTHLLAHVVGDEFYVQEGLDAMAHCTPAFRNACSHSIVIGALLNEGMSVFDEIYDVCEKAPGKGTAYTMCFHGFGHGVLAYAEYEMPDAVELCMRLGTEKYNHYESIECIGGAVMEMRDGFHDKEVWEEKYAKYVDKDNPTSLCVNDYIPNGEAREMCLIYLTPFLADSVNESGRGLEPNDELLAAAFKQCDALVSEKDKIDCYSGFGKEFAVMIHGGDVRDVPSTTRSQMQQMAAWCRLAEYSEGREACLIKVLGSLFWGGEYPYNLSSQFCSVLMDNKSESDACFEIAIKNMSANLQHITPPDRNAFCSSVPEYYRDYCKQVLL